MLQAPCYPWFVNKRLAVQGFCNFVDGGGLIDIILKRYIYLTPNLRCHKKKKNRQQNVGIIYSISGVLPTEKRRKCV